MRPHLRTLAIGTTLGFSVLTGRVSAQTVIVPGPPITIAQRIFQGIEHFDPHDRLWLQPQGIDAQAATENGYQSSLIFACTNCDPYYDSVPLFLDYFTSHSAAISNAVNTIQLEGPPDISPYFPVYVAGDATMTGPAPPRIVRAFSLAVRKQVVTYKHS